MGEKKNANLILIKIIKSFAEAINFNFDVDMRLYQPGIEPLSVLGKEEEVILFELQKNLILILNRLNDENSISLPGFAFHSFFGVSPTELKKLSARLKALIPLTQLQDAEFAKSSLYAEALNQKEAILNSITENMLLSYVKEGVMLVLDLKGNTQSKQTQKDGWNVSSPKSLSTFFRIFHKNSNNCYCSVIDAIEDNRDKEMLALK